ncbi:hypothetical protein HWV62_10413 [Athelia sp. TMB]|nr:hypothetical protein HWV62_10413 [Athelia sp. TMB]
MSLPPGISLTEPIPVLMTGILQSLLQGAICAQTVRYSEVGYDSDSPLLRAFVGLVVLLSVFETALEDYKMWAVLIHREIWEQQSVFWFEPFLNGLIVSLCSAYLIRRCWKVTGKKTWVLVALGIVALGLMAANAFMEQLRPTGQKSSDRVLFKLAFIAWETALVPAVSMLAAIILYSSSANKNGKINQYPYFLFVMTGKLYTVEFLRSLNVRTKLLAQMQTQDLGRVSLGNETWEQIKSTGTTSGDLLIPSTLAGPRVVPGSDLSLSQTVDAPPQRVANTTPPPSEVDDHLFTSPQMLAQEQGMSTGSLGLYTLRNRQSCKVLCAMAEDETNSKPSGSTEAVPRSAADASVSAQPSNPPAQSDASTSAAGETAVVANPESRAALIERAKMFLLSPQIRHENLLAKRRFLVEKGLSEAEIDGLLQQLPPPSNLPNLLIGLARIITWVVGGSAVALLFYYRFLLPRLSSSLQARASIQAHQKDLLSRLTTSIHALKDTQSETFTILPKPRPFQENAEYKECHTLEQVIAAGGETPQDVPSFSILRCALEEFDAQNKEASTEELFALMTAKLPWLQSEEGAKYRDDLWSTLSSNSAFSYTDTDETSIWKYTAPVPSSPPPLMSSLATLRSTMPQPQPEKNSALQHALQTISEFTGYLTTQIYAMPIHRPPGFGPSQTLNPEEEELRKEIRALKGLVLNRCA